MRHSVYYSVIITDLTNFISVFNDVINFSADISELIIVINVSESYYFLMIFFF